MNVRFGTYSAERFMLSGKSNNTEMNTIMKQNVRVGLEVILIKNNIRLTSLRHVAHNAPLVVSVIHPLSFSGVG